MLLLKFYTLASSNVILFGWRCRCPRKWLPVNQVLRLFPGSSAKEPSIYKIRMTCKMFQSTASRRSRKIPIELVLPLAAYFAYKRGNTTFFCQKCLGKFKGFFFDFFHLTQMGSLPSVLTVSSSPFLHPALPMYLLTTV